MSKSPPSRVKNLTYAALAGQTGCVSLAVVLVALLVGLWLDAQFGLRGPFTIGVLLLSIPISLFLMIRIALGAVKSIQPQPRTEKHADATKKKEE